MKLTRRMFLAANAVGASALTMGATPAAAATMGAVDGAAMLVDATRCVGCRGCEAACSEANGLPEPVRLADDHVFDRRRETEPQVFTVVNRQERPVKGSETLRFAKTQCMHCVEPACASACPARALEKTAAGAVVYHGDRCLGCRYCMVACPFDVPKFEYTKTMPYVRKCFFCAERQANGELPACAEVCPSGALTFGKRSALLEEAKTRIYQNPDKYVHHIYGEREAGGTSWLYISDVPFENLGFKPNVQQAAYGELTETALSAVPVVITLWPPLLMGLYTFSQRRNAVAGEDASVEEDRHE